MWEIDLNYILARIMFTMNFRMIFEMIRRISWILHYNRCNGVTPSKNYRSLNSLKEKEK